MVMKFRRPVIARKKREYAGMMVNCSGAYTIQALRASKVTLGNAREWKVLRETTSFTIPDAPGRNVLIDDAADSAIERVAARCGPRHSTRRGW